MKAKYYSCNIENIKVRNKNINPYHRGTRRYPACRCSSRKNHNPTPYHNKSDCPYPCPLNLYHWARSCPSQRRRALRRADSWTSGRQSHERRHTRARIEPAMKLWYSGARRVCARGYPGRPGGSSPARRSAIEAAAGRLWAHRRYRKVAYDRRHLRRCSRRRRCHRRRSQPGRGCCLEVDGSLPHLRRWLQRHRRRRQGDG